MDDLEYNDSVRNPAKKTWRNNLKVPVCSVCGKKHAYQVNLEICMSCGEYICPDHRYRHPKCSEGR